MMPSSMLNDPSITCRIQQRKETTVNDSAIIVAVTPSIVGAFESAAAAADTCLGHTGCGTGPAMDI
jgi:hypothetical protein